MVKQKFSCEVESLKEKEVMRGNRHHLELVTLNLDEMWPKSVYNMLEKVSAVSKFLNHLVCRSIQNFVAGPISKSIS